MKKFLMTALLLTFTSVAHASLWDATLSGLWQNLVQKENFHWFDNGTAAYFYDFNKHEHMYGSVTGFYEYKYFALEAGGIKSGETENSFPAFGINYRLGKQLARTKVGNYVVGPLKPYVGFMKYLAVGGWAARDFDNGIYRYGVYGGLQREFGK